MFRYLGTFVLDVNLVRQVFHGFFVSDVISEVVFGSFWHMLSGLGPNC